MDGQRADLKVVLMDFAMVDLKDGLKAYSADLKVDQKGRLRADQ